MTEAPKPKKGLSPEAQRATNAKRDETFFAEKKAQDVRNQAKTERLKALRLAHEAANPKVSPAPRGKKK